MPAPFKNPKEGREIRSNISSFPAFFHTRKQRVVASNIWSFLNQLSLDKLSSKDAKQACAYLEQSFEFFEAAKNPRTGSKPLLYYYCFLNLAKLLFLFKKINFPIALMHGIKDPRENERERLQFQGQSVKILSTRGDHSNLFPELIRALAGKVKTGDIKVIDLISQIPGIHLSYSSIVRRSPSFIPIENKIVKSNGSEVWAQFSIKIRNDNDRLNINKLRARHIFSSLYHQISNSTKNEVWFESNPETGRNRGIDNAIKKLQDKLSMIGIWSLLTNRGYRFYFSTYSKWLPQLASMYAVMFYLGSITRYRPYDFDKILKGGFAWLVEEFLTTQPTQFLYVLASTLAEVDIVKPFCVYD